MTSINYAMTSSEIMEIIVGDRSHNTGDTKMTSVETVMTPLDCKYVIADDNDFHWESLEIIQLLVRSSEIYRGIQTFTFVCYIGVLAENH